MALQTVTIQGKVLTPAGVAPTSGVVRARLSKAGSVLDGTASQRVAGETSVAIGADGSISLAIVPNDAITPSGTVYEIDFAALEPNGVPVRWHERWQLASTPNPIDLGAVPRLDVVPGVAVAPPPGDATASVKGLVQLAGDLGGTASLPTVAVTPTGSTTKRSLADLAADVPRGLAGSADRQRANTVVTFRPVGPVGWLNPLGTKNEVVTVVRSGNLATAIMQGVEATVAANLLRCTDVPVLGALIEPLRTNYVTTPDNPGVQSFSVPTGALRTVAWIEGSGSAVLAQTGGTPVASGLPATITAGTPIVFDVSGGSGSATLSLTPTGSVTFAQVEWGGQNPGFPTSRIHAGGVTRPADVVSLVNPVTTGAVGVCVRATPLAGRTWTDYTGTLWSSGGLAGAANTARIYLSSGYLYFDTYDAGGVNRRLTHDIRSWTDTRTHEICAFMGADGSMTLWLDGLYQDLAWAGTGAPTTFGTPLYVGGQSNGQSMFGGVISEIRIVRGVGPGGVGPIRLDPFSIIAFGDSLSSYGAPPYVTTLATLLGPAWKSARYAYPGEWSSYAIWNWYYPARSSGAKYAVVMLGVNDINQGYAGLGGVNTIAALREIYDSAADIGVTVIPVTILPAGGQAFWGPTHEALRTTINAWIRSYGASRGLPVVDAAPLFDDGTGKLMAIYDNGDHLHLNQAGYDYLASLIRAAFP